ncbi:M20 aminoacylase family protein [Roseomonas elaeocarpi]|uniref:M20 aminoacylase family protein n=1 Tax=Roseomonas elaeocarpi TaxID=907779 RepID=A0ABV6JUG3_9PROT
MPVHNRIAEFHDEMTAWRHDFHRHPELSYQEHRTGGLVAERLRAFGCDEVVTGLAQTGVVGVIRGSREGGAIGLRADMDALPVVEDTDLPFRSATPGVMHACGHDGHTTMLLGAAKYLAETRNFAGTVYVIFQPAEEQFGGGGAMVREGLFERFPMDRIFGIHNWPALPAGQFGWRVGPLMAAVANIDITVHGTGAHGAMPHQGNDPVVIAAQIISALQSVVSRNVEPAEAGVVTIAHVEGGHTFNVIPETVRMRGTARWFKREVGDLIERKVVEIATGIAAAFGAKAEVVFERTYPATVNESESTRLAERAAATVVGAAKVRELSAPTMGGEDFSFMLDAKDGAYLFLGAGTGAGDAGLHHPQYRFNDAILPMGASFFATLAEQLLPR